MLHRGFWYKEMLHTRLRMGGQACDRSRNGIIRALWWVLGYHKMRGHSCSDGGYQEDTVWCLSHPISLPPASILAAARSKAWVCDCRLLGLWVRILSGGWTSISRECCVFSSRVLCEGPITRPENSECGMCERDFKASTTRRPRTTSAAQPWK